MGVLSQCLLLNDTADGTSDQCEKPKQILRIAQALKIEPWNLDSIELKPLAEVSGDGHERDYITRPDLPGYDRCKKGFRGVSSRKIKRSVSAV